MLNCKVPTPTTSKLGIAAATLLQISGDEIDGYVPNVPPGETGFDYTAQGTLINRDFSVLRITTPLGQPLGMVIILHAAVDATGQLDPDREARQDARLQPNAIDVQGCYGQFLVDAAGRVAPTDVGGKKHATTLEYWLWDDPAGAWPNDFDVQIEAWGIEIPPIPATPEVVPAMRFDSNQKAVPAGCWAIEVDGQATGWFDRKPTFQDWFHEFSDSLIDPGMDGAWAFRRMPDGAPGPGHKYTLRSDNV